MILNIPNGMVQGGRPDCCPPSDPHLLACAMRAIHGQVTHIHNLRSQ
jgi:hypothetical protein